MNSPKPGREELLEIAAEVWEGRRPRSDLEKYGIVLGDTIEGEAARDQLLAELEALDVAGDERVLRPETRRSPVNNSGLLKITSLLSLLLLTLHVTDDIVRGISPAQSSNTALVVLVIFLYGTLVLTERRSGLVIMFLVGLFAAGMPVIHMRGTHYPDIAASPGGFFFVWTLWALGALGGVTMILSVRGLWSLRRSQTRPP